MRRLWGALFWSLFLLFSLALHGREERKKLAEYRGLCLLASHLKSALSHAPEPLPSIYSRFSDPALARAGFLPLLKKEGLLSALSSGTLHLEQEDLLPFQSYAEGLGTRLYIEELGAIDALLSTVTAILSQKETALPVRQKLTGTLFFSGGMLLLLLLL